MPLPFGPTMPKNSPSATENVTSRSASFRSYATRFSGWAKYSLSRARCSCGIRNAFETPTTSIARRGHARSANRGASRRCNSTPTASTATGDRDRDEPRVDARRHAERGRIRAEQDQAHVLHHLDERVQLGETLGPEREDRDRVHDRRREEEERRRDLPDLTDVAEADVERRRDEREAEDERVQLEQERHEQEPVEARADVRLTARKSATATQFARNVIAAASDVASGITSGGNETRRSVGRARDDRRQRRRDRVGEERVEHDPDQQVERVARDAGLEEAPEDDPEHA